MDMHVQRSRRPAVAGYFYPLDPAVLADDLGRLTHSRATASRVAALVVPHGSYHHCGHVLGETFSRVIVPRRCVIVGPAHTNSALTWSLMVSGWYRTPLGEVPIDTDAAEALCNRCAFLQPDAWAQAGEHSIEVVLPFLQHLGPADLSIVPIITSSQNPSELADLGTALAQLVRLQEEAVLLIASSDLSHYQPKERSAYQDAALSRAIARVDAGELVRLVHDDGIIMCGYAAVAAVLNAARELGAREGEIVASGTSAQAGGDPQSVIGYTGIVIR